MHMKIPMISFLSPQYCSLWSFITAPNVAARMGPISGDINMLAARNNVLEDWVMFGDDPSAVELRLPVLNQAEAGNNAGDHQDDCEVERYGGVGLHSFNDLRDVHASSDGANEFVPARFLRHRLVRGRFLIGVFGEMMVAVQSAWNDRNRRSLALADAVIAQHVDRVIATDSVLKGKRDLIRVSVIYSHPRRVRNLVLADDLPHNLLHRRTAIERIRLGSEEFINRFLVCFHASSILHQSHEPVAVHRALSLA